MAKLIMKDGQTRNIGYSQAAHIYQILIGNEEPKDDKQALYISQIHGVEFDTPTKVARYTGSGDITKRFLEYHERRQKEEDGQLSL